MRRGYNNSSFLFWLRYNKIVQLSEHSVRTTTVPLQQKTEHGALLVKKVLNMENVICGFIELNGELVKISSVEDLKAFATRLGSAFTELTTQDYEKLCAKMQGEFETDDCGVLYSKDGRKVFLAPITSNEYIIKSGAIAITSYAFNWHYYLYNGVLSTNNKYIYEKNISKLLIPDSVIAIGSEAFGDNNAIEKIIVSQKLEYIGQRAFRGCKKMKGFCFPPSVKYIETEAFDGCYNAFNELTIPASVKYIGSHAFRDCLTIEKVILSGPIDKIGSGIFESCDKLSAIVVPKGCVEQFREQLPFYSEIITEASEE